MTGFAEYISARRAHASCVRLAERGEGGAQTCLKREVLLVSLLPPLRLKAVDRCVYSVKPTLSSVRVDI